jgi:multidrug resistance efflux pump
MKTNNPSNKVKSTYSMLVQSEEKERNLFETLAYSVIVMSTVVAIWQVAHQPVKVPFTDQAHASAAQAAVVSHS